MNDCPNSSLQIEHTKDIVELKTKVCEQEKKIDKLDEIRDAVVTMSVLFKEFQNDAKERNKVVEKQVEILSELKDEVKQTKDKVEDLDTKVNNLQTEVKEIKGKTTIKIDTLVILRKVVLWFILPAGGIAGILKLLGII